MTNAVITANDLRDGDVVFWSKGGWVDQVAEAELFPDAASADAVVEAAKTQVTRINDPYRVDVILEDGFPVPVSYRERVRALGPTIHPDRGKQAQGGPAIAAITAHAGAGLRSSGRLGLIRRK
jgi:hypothetical protein